MIATWIVIQFEMNEQMVTLSYVVEPKSNKL